MEANPKQMKRGLKQEGRIFNIQKFSIHDGQGIRTLIFMKGCPLRCLWCSNPESRSFEPEILFVRKKCIACGKCVSRCPQSATGAADFAIDRGKCVVCGRCAEKCYAGAKKTVGERRTIEDLLEVIEEDRTFYLNSGGGVTVGGGEPVAQPEFVGAFLKACRSPDHSHGS